MVSGEALTTRSCNSSLSSLSLLSVLTEKIVSRLWLGIEIMDGGCDLKLVMEVVRSGGVGGEDTSEILGSTAVAWENLKLWRTNVIPVSLNWI